MQLFVDQLTNVDFSFLHAERGMLGETWLASALLDGAVDDEGMICDFSIVKRTLRNWLDDEVDHRLLVPTQSPALELKQEGDQISLTWQFSDQSLSVTGPAQAFALVDAESITAESVAVWCKLKLKDHFPVNVEQLTLSFETEAIAGAFYHYSHGLKLHNGNCQRIAHGHRSRILIWLNEERSLELEQLWAQRWQDIYLGFDEDVVGYEDGQIHFAYEAAQGHFELSMPASSCYLIGTQTTVEFLAEHLADAIKQQHPQAQVKVKAFEGINKGAISTR